jgi:hypothetical protein
MQGCDCERAKRGAIHGEWMGDVVRVSCPGTESQGVVASAATRWIWRDARVSSKPGKRDCPTLVAGVTKGCSISPAFNRSRPRIDRIFHFETWEALH